MSALAFRDLGVEVGGRKLLGAIDLSLGGGELVALLGLNGAGKSTLLRAALGLARATPGGAVLLGGDDVRQLSARERAARVAWLPQHVSVPEGLSAVDVVVAGRYRFDETFKQSRTAATRALERVRAAELARRPLTELSGGERQRVAFAALIAQEAPLLLLDEPANHLDPAQQIEIYRLIGELVGEGKAVLTVTHDVNLLRFAGRAERIRVVGLGDGQLRFALPWGADGLPAALAELFQVTAEALVDARGRSWIVTQGPSSGASPT